MPITFECPKCQRKLRTSEEHAGREVKCPGCGEPLIIPRQPLPDDLELELSAAPPLAAASRAPAPQYQAASYSAEQSAAPPGSIRPTRISIGDTLGATWKIFKRNWGTCVGAVFVMLLVIGAMNGAVRTMFPQPRAGAQVNLNFGLAGMAVMLVSLAANIWLQCGLIYLMLRVARGDSGAGIADLFAGGKWLLNFFAVSVVVSLIVMVGLILLIVPGIYLGLMLWPCQYLVVDRNFTVGEALASAREITSGNKLTVFLMYLLAAIVGGLLTVVTLGLGAFFVFPFLMLAMAVTYLKMSGQPTAADRLP